MSMEVNNSTLTVEGMSMENKRKMEWKNIGKLYRFWWMQRWKWLIVVAIMMVVMIVTNALDMIFWTPEPDDLSLIVGVGDGVTSWVVMMLVCVVISAANVLTAQNISMYPGTVKTRFISRVLFDYSLLGSGMLCMLLGHLLDMGVIKIIAGSGAPVFDNVLFDVKTLVFRITICLAYFLLIYNVFLLVYAIITKAGMLKSAIGIGIIVITGIILARQGILYKFIMKLSGYFLKADLGYVRALMRTLGWAAVFLILAYGVMLLVHSWRDDMKAIWGVAFALVYIVTMAGLFSEVGYYDDTADANVYYSLEQDIQDGKVISSDRTLHIEKLDARNLKGYGAMQENGMTLDGMGFSMGWVEYERAKEIGLIPDDLQLLEGEVYVRIVTDSSKYKDTYIYKDIIDNIKFDIVGGKYKVDPGKKRVAYDKFITLFDGVLGKDITTVQWQYPEINEEVITSTLETCQVHIIYHQDDVMYPEELECYYYGRSYSLPWYGEPEYPEGYELPEYFED